MALSDAHLLNLQQDMRKGHFDKVLQQTDVLLSEHSKDIELIYIRAVCARYLKRYELAREILNDLKTINPEFGRALQEEGHLSRDQGQLDQALSFYRSAVQVNPGLVASWKAQAEILTQMGRTQGAEQARHQADRLTALPKALVSVTNLIHEKKLLKAEKICREFLRKHPHHIEAMRLLAEIAARFGVLRDADFLLESAIEFEQDNIQLRLDHIKILRKRQKFARALEQAEYLYKSDSNNPVFQSHLAVEHMQTGDHKTALALFDEVLSKHPNDPMTLTSKGHALKTYGQHDAAVESYRSAFQAKPSHGDAYFGLANLKTYRFKDTEIRQMLEHAERPDIGFMDRIHLCFSLGKAFEDQEEFERSFEFYQRGNDLKTLQSRYEPSDMTREVLAQSSLCNAELFKKHSKHGYESSDPIFIVGLPRAGSTLLEQILASHSQIDGTLELPNILSQAYKLRGREPISMEGRYPKILHDLSSKQLEDMGKTYIEETRIHRKEAPLFIDKMPNNFRHIGLIHLILPNAKIIDARRHPMACCFSGFKQLFAEGQEFTYGQHSIGRYYRDYVELMHHWDRVLPGKVLRMQYEDVVADIETQVRRMLDYIGLPFEKACVEFHKTSRSIRTASSEQVRQPLYTSGLAQWKNYEPWLKPLKTALRPALETYNE